MRAGTKAFSIVEIIVVIILITIVVGFGMPNYRRAVAKAEERTVRTNLMTIRSAIGLYITNAQVSTIPDMADLQAINTTLGLSIIDDTTGYSCVGSSGGQDNQCTAAHPNGWAIHFHYTGAHNTDRTLHCSSGGCPSCPAPPGNCG